MLTDLKRVSERQEIEADRFRSVAATLITRQFIYYDMDRDRKTYLTLANNATYFENLFDALNHNFILDQEVGMVGILPRNRMTSMRLKKVEALLLLTLRYLYEEALESYAIKNGCAYTNSEKLIAKYQFATGAEERPGLTELRHMLIEFRRLGLIDDINEVESRTLDFRIRPAVRVVLNESWFKTLEQHAGIIAEEEEEDRLELEADIEAENDADEEEVDA
ncbi:MAG: DUF4194 domain-containing protein [Desulfuromonas sp.]|nr:DUF4194 domain-containing protein [Desulfuromonas sp.]